MNIKVLGKNIVYLRKKNDITQLILAEKIAFQENNYIIMKELKLKIQRVLYYHKLQ